MPFVILSWRKHRHLSQISWKFISCFGLKATNANSLVAVKRGQSVRKVLKATTEHRDIPTLIIFWEQTDYICAVGWHCHILDRTPVSFCAQIMKTAGFFFFLLSKSYRVSHLINLWKTSECSFSLYIIFYCYGNSLTS